MSEPRAIELKKQFIGWQCRIRQYSVRRDEGRPSPGMRPELFLESVSVGRFTLVLIKTHSEKVTKEFRYLVKRTQDPQKRCESAIKLLSEYYYQIPGEFDEELTAVFSLHSELADRIVATGRCKLVFDQGNQTCDLDCVARFIDQADSKYQTTYWHNHLFNPAMPGAVKIIGFQADWEKSDFRGKGVSVS